MENRWRIPKDVEQIVISRDKTCVYCGAIFQNSSLNRKSRPTWEHIINDIKINDPDNIALCCTSCNASKGSKILAVWLKSRYCEAKGITFETVAPVVRKHLE